MSDIKLVEYYPYSELVRISIPTKHGYRLETFSVSALEKLENTSEVALSDFENAVRKILLAKGGVKWLKEEIQKHQKRSLEDYGLTPSAL